MWMGAVAFGYSQRSVRFSACPRGQIHYQGLCKASGIRIYSKIPEPPPNQKLSKKD